MGCCRLLLAISVVLVHSGVFSPMIGGELAVQAFFAMSGFYMSLILNGKYAAGDYWLFLSNRLIRLLPTYWVVLAISLVINGLFYVCADTATVSFTTWVDHWSTLSNETRLYLLGANLFLLGQDWLMFTALAPDTGELYFAQEFAREAVPSHVFLIIPPAWSLGLELTFYIIAPWIVRRRIRVLAGLVCISFLIRAVSYAVFTHRDPWSYRFFPAEVGVFLFGVLAQRLSCRDAEGRLHGIFNHAGWVVLAIVCAFICSLRISKDFAVLAAFACCLPILFSTTNSSHLDRFLGELSYPVYIGHGLVATLIVLTCRTLHIEITAALSAVALVCGSLLMAVWLNFLIERPIDRIRQRRVAKPGQI